MSRSAATLTRSSLSTRFGDRGDVVGGVIGGRVGGKRGPGLPGGIVVGGRRMGPPGRGNGNGIGF